MADELVVGRVIRSSTGSFSLGCKRLISEQDQLIPQFGALVKALHPARPGAPGVTYGLVHNVTIEDDPFVRQLVAAGLEREDIIEDQRQNRQVPILVDILTVGMGCGLEVEYCLPPQPPLSLDKIYACNNAEIVRFTAGHDWMRNVLAAREVVAEQLLPAALRAAAQARPPSDRQPYLLVAGQALARLLALDLPRLEAILRQLRVPSPVVINQPAAAGVM